MNPRPAEAGDALSRPEVRATLDRLHSAARGDIWQFAKRAPLVAAVMLGREPDAGTMSRIFKDAYLPVSRQQGQFLYLTACATGAKNIVEFGTSFGISTIYLAAAARHNGGKVIGSELEP